MNKKLLVSVFLCFFVLSLGIIAQEEERMIVRQERKRMKIQAAMAEPGDIIYVYVDDATGDDKKGEGTEKKPYKTIGRALEVAESADWIKVGAGVYSESLNILDPSPFVLEGSGSGSTIIDGSIWVERVDLITIIGFTIRGDPNRRDVIRFLQSFVGVEDCTIDCQYHNVWTGIEAQHTDLWLYNTKIINAEPEGWGVRVWTASEAWIVDCIIQGGDHGVVVAQTACAWLENCEIKDSRNGVCVEDNAYLCLLAGPNSIHHNDRGIDVESGGVLISWGSENKIFYNEEAGIYLGQGGQARLFEINVHDNPIGINATQASILEAYGGFITNNDIGIEVSEFAHAFLGDFSISSNRLWDVYIHTGGQAICNPDNIGSINSTCPHCPSK